MDQRPFPQNRPQVQAAYLLLVEQKLLLAGLNYVRFGHSFEGKVALLQVAVHECHTTKPAHTKRSSESGSQSEAVVLRL